MDLLEIKSHWVNKNNMNQNKMQTTIISKVLINTKIKTTISNIQKIFKNNPKIKLQEDNTVMEIMLIIKSNKTTLKIINIRIKNNKELTTLMQETHIQINKIKQIQLNDNINSKKRKKISYNQHLILINHQDHTLIKQTRVQKQKTELV